MLIQPSRPATAQGPATAPAPAPADPALTFALPPVIDGSFVNDIIRCLRYAYYRHVMHRVPLKRHPALDFGTAFHDAVHEWYISGCTADGIAKGLTIWDAYETPEDAGTRTQELGKARFEEYCLHYKHQPFELLRLQDGTPCSETGFCLPLTSDITYGGRIDRIIKWNDGRIYISDLKTASALGQYWLKQFRPHLSFTGYIWGASQIINQPICGAHIDGVSTAKSPQYKYLRDITTRTPREFHDFKTSVRRSCARFLVACKMAETEDPLDAFYMEPHSCSSYSGCPYRDLCNSGCSPAIVNAKYAYEIWHPYSDGEEAGGSADPDKTFYRLPGAPSNTPCTRTPSA